MVLEPFGPCAVSTYVWLVPSHVRGSSSLRLPFGYEANTPPPLMLSVTRVALRVSQRSSTLVLRA